MSDYLWDKTGEPDAEVERLEALLGTLGHRPRTLALPLEVAPDVRRPPRFLKPVWLAAAAALLLASLVGAAAYLRARSATEVKGVAAVSETPRPQEGVRRDAAPIVPEPPARSARNGVVKDEPSGLVKEVPSGGLKDEKAAVENLEPVPPGRKSAQLASLPRRRQPKAAAPARGVTSSGGGSTFETMSAGGGGAPSLFDSTRLMAKEQLVYALRLTGAKLRDVQQRTQGRDINEAGQP